MSSFFLKKLISILLQPPLMPWLLIVIGLVISYGWPRFGKRLTWLGVWVMLLLTMPVTVAWIARPLERFPVIDQQALTQAQAIVILAGGQRSHAIEFGGAAVNRLTLERMRYGAKLIRETHLPVLLTGGAPTGSIPEATLMEQSLKEDFGLDAKWVETRSLDTEDNARYSAQILKDAGIHKVILVTHSLHMLRSVNEFKAQGIEVIPAPTVFVNNAPGDDELFDYIPTINSTYNGWYALHEWMGIAAQKLRMIYHAKKQATSDTQTTEAAG